MKYYSEYDIQSNPSLYNKNLISFITGRLIRRMREIKQISQSNLAQRSAANLTYISTMESGENNPSIRKLLMFCNGLEVEPARLIAMQTNILESSWLDMKKDL